MPYTGPTPDTYWASTDIPGSDTPALMPGSPAGGAESAGYAYTVEPPAGMQNPIEQMPGYYEGHQAVPANQLGMEPKHKAALANGGRILFAAVLGAVGTRFARGKGKIKVAQYLVGAGAGIAAMKAVRPWLGGQRWAPPAAAVGAGWLAGKGVRL